MLQASQISLPLFSLQISSLTGPIFACIEENLQITMKSKTVGRIRKFLSKYASGPRTPIHRVDVDLREEYANAFRTESYIEFWERVLAVHDDIHSSSPSMHTLAGFTTATRLPSYRLFAEHLLDPDQPTVIRVLSLAHIRSGHKILLSKYFSETANASILCSSLLKYIDCTRSHFNGLRSTLQSLNTIDSTSLNQFPDVMAQLNKLLDSTRPWVGAPSSPTRIHCTLVGCSELLNQLESNRVKTKTKLRLIRGLKNGSATLLVALTASLTIIIMAHGLPLLVATPGLVAASLEADSTRRLTRVLAQLDAAAKGTYILKRDMDTISRLVARLNNEVEHMREMVRFWLERGEDRIQASGEVARQLNKNDCNFIEQLDELEEHLYLCFMTINRARNLVVKEILDPSSTHQDSGFGH